MGSRKWGNLKEERGKRNPQDDCKKDTNAMAERFILIIQWGIKDRY